MKTFKLEVTEEVLMVISEGLAQLPYGRVANVIAGIQKQINEQVQQEAGTGVPSAEVVEEQG